MASLLPTNLINQSMTESQTQAKALLDNAIKNANTYLQGMKSLAGVPEGQTMKTMNREQMDLGNLQDYYKSQGLVAPMTSTDPSADIRKIGELWSATSDPALKNQYHQQALDLATKSGWIQPGQDANVNSLGQMTAAGTPSYDTKQDDIATALKMEQLAKSGSGGTGGTGGTNTGEIKPPTAMEKLIATSALKDRIYKEAQVRPYNEEGLNAVKTLIESMRPQYELEGADVDSAISYLQTLYSGEYPKSIRAAAE